MMNERLTANSNADLEKMTDTIHRLLSIVWGDGWGVFSEESPVDNEAEKAQMPHITYNLVSRTHTQSKNVKWARFHSEEDPEHEGESLTHYKCWFTCQVEFTIYDDTNRGTRNWAEKFETFMENYMGYLKQEGISEIIFKEESAPSVNSNYRQDLPYRTLRYEVRIERTIVESSYDLNQVDIVLNEIDINAKVKHPSGNVDDYKAQVTKDNPVKTHLGNNQFLDLYNQHF